MKIATWNVNSIRTRLDHVLNWLEANPVEALCLQETKVMDGQFPQQPFLDRGYHLSFAGQKSYNGVAIISHVPLSNVSMGFAPVLGETVADLDEQKRVITGVLGEVRILNLYVPNGSAIGSEKYDYKLRWLSVLHDYLQEILQPEVGQLLVCGDFNIALEDIDIHNPAGRENHIMASDTERKALRTVLDLGLADAFRKFTAEGGHFSWWDYRSGSFRRNAGWRIDHIYLTPDLYRSAVRCEIDPVPRQWEQPSDHTPVIVTLG